MAIEIIDTPNDVRRYLPRLDDVHTVIRYITSLSPSSEKHVKLAEIKAIKAAGKKVGIVHEVYGDFKHAGRGGVSGPDGVRDGKYSRSVLPQLGAPAGAAVYFAVDCDASPAQLRDNVLPYFKAASAAFRDGEYRVGVYGPGAVCAAVINAGFAELGWLSNAKGWKGYQAFLPRAHLVQRIPTKIAGGLDVDPNVAQQEDWGQFEPFVDDVEIIDGPPQSRLGSGDPESSPLPFVDEYSPTGQTSGFLAGAKSLVKSKIAWLGGGLGTSAATTAVTSDPDTQGLLWQLLHKPAFWLFIAFLLAAGGVLYYRWRDHGKGSV